MCYVHYAPRLEKCKAYYNKNSIRIIKRVKERENRYEQEGRCKRCGIELIEEEGKYCVNCVFVKSNHSLKGVL